MLSYVQKILWAALVNTLLMVVAVADELPNKSWNVPVRYAFITDKNIPQMAVFDTYTQSMVAQIPLQTVPDSIDISPQGGFILYANYTDKMLYRLDLRSNKQQKTSVSSLIKQLDVHASGRWVSYTTDGGVVIKDFLNTKDTMIHTEGEVSLLYAPSGDSLFINEQDTGRLTRVNLDNMQQQELFNVNQSISPISVMPNMMALFFSSGDKLYRYSLLDEVLQDYPHIVSTERPYITSESRHVLTLNQADKTAPQLLLVNSYSLSVKHRYPLKRFISGNDNIVTGWLEQTAVVIAEKKIESINVNSHVTKPIPLTGQIIDYLVQADSKVLLATMTQSSQLLVFNMKTQAVDALIDTGLTHPNHVLMGQTATLCH